MRLKKVERELACLKYGGHCAYCGVVLDPFGDAGTTSLVSMQEGRMSILCELKALARARIDAAWLDGATQMDVFHDTPPAS